MVFYLSGKSPGTQTSSGSRLTQFTIKTNTRNLFSTLFVQIRGDKTKTTQKNHIGIFVQYVLFHMFNIPLMKNIE